MPNRLRDSASPYLRQHADNPVDWHEWGPEALARARDDHKPILLSIGYAACHWCHVMAHESFEDAATAALMNELFVNIKVDREERPDLDSIYMQAVQALTGHGGWPMTVFLTPDGVPFHGGTYFPPEDRHGIPSFQRVLRAVATAWREQPDKVAQSGQALTEYLQRAAAPAGPGQSVDRHSLALAFRSLAQQFDQQHGGFGGAPKFPPSMALDFLLRHWARTREPLAIEIVSRTHAAMRSGGIYDQVGGGLHRYSVDAAWLVPHFEKMLYDNAQFARLGVRVWQATGDQEARQATEQTLDWALREMLDDSGAFHSSLDADSEGHEGRFYVWDLADVQRIAGTDADVAIAHWGVTQGGNFEGSNILFVPDGVGATAARTGRDVAAVRDALARVRRRLYEARAKRTWPLKDDKVVASWNGLMIRAFVEAARAFQRDDYREAAIRAGRGLRSTLVRDDRVMRSALRGRVSGPGLLEDFAATGLAFVDLYGLTFDTDWLRASRAIASQAVDLFLDPVSGTWFDTARDHERLIVRPREVTDNATPSGTSLMADLLLHWSRLDDLPQWGALAEAAVHQAGETIARYPQALGYLAGVADALVYGSAQVALSGPVDDVAFRKMEDRLGSAFIPSLVLAGGDPDDPTQPALMANRHPIEGAPTAFACRRFACELPTRDPGELVRQVEQMSKDAGAERAPESGRPGPASGD